MPLHKDDPLTPSTLGAGVMLALHIYTPRLLPPSQKTWFDPATGACFLSSCRPAKRPSQMMCVHGVVVVNLGSSKRGDEEV